MAILIENMEMPKNCDSCRIMEFEDTNCINEFYCGCPIVFQAHPQGVDHRPDYCPLIEVPEPHGDLIDRKALMEGEGRYFISICKEGIDVEEILRAKTIIPASKEE